MAKTFNEFQRELRNRGIEGHQAIMFTMMYEQILEMGKQLDMCAKIIGELVDTVGNTVELHKNTQSRMKDLHQRIAGEKDGVYLESVPLTNDPE